MESRTRIRVRPASPVADPVGSNAQASSFADYEVGYKRPPKATRFKPGQSGNPKGRPKESKNLADTVRDYLDGSTTVRQGGRTLKMKRRDVLVRQLFERTVKGDNRAAALLLSLSGKSAERPLGPSRTSASEAEDLAMLHDFLKQLSEA